MSFYGSRALGQFGLGVMGAFGDGGRPIFPGGPGFLGTDTPEAWTSTYSGWTGHGYVPPSQGVLNAAGAVWQALQNATAPSDVAFLQSMQDTLAAQIKEADAAVGDHSGFGYTDAATKRGVNALNMLKASVNAIASHQVLPNPSPPVYASPQPVAQIGPTGSQTYQSTTSGGGTTLLGGQAAATGAPAGGDNTMLYIGLGVGAVVLIGGMLYLRKRRSSVAGYRRRRRSRR